MSAQITRVSQQYGRLSFSALNHLGTNRWVTFCVSKWMRCSLTSLSLRPHSYEWGVALCSESIPPLVNMKERRKIRRLSAPLGRKWQVWTWYHSFSSLPQSRLVSFEYLPLAFVFIHSHQTNVSMRARLVNFTGPVLNLRELARLSPNCIFKDLRVRMELRRPSHAHVVFFQDGKIFVSGVKKKEDGIGGEKIARSLILAHPQ